MPESTHSLLLSESVKIGMPESTHSLWLSESVKIGMPEIILIAEGLAQWLRSLPPNPEVPGSIPGLIEG